MAELSIDDGVVVLFPNTVALERGDTLAVRLTEAVEADTGGEVPAELFTEATEVDTDGEAVAVPLARKYADDTEVAGANMLCELIGIDDMLVEVLVAFAPNDRAGEVALTITVLLVDAVVGKELDEVLAEVLDGVTTYIDKPLGPPQTSLELLSQGILQRPSVVVTLPAPRLFPQ